MKLFKLIVVLALFTTGLNAQVSISGTSGQKNGWMPNGWGSYNVVVENTSEKSVTLTSWEIHWKDGRAGRVNEINKELAPGEKWRKNEIGYLSQSLVEKSGKKGPIKEGYFMVNADGKEKKVKYSFPIPASYLPEPTKLISSSNCGMELQESRYKEFKNVDRTMKWLGQAYDAMTQLTGGTPYGGKMVVFKECVEHPYWAYAGQEIILNTRYVGSTLSDFDKGLMSFGWIHELGHDFDDGTGQWYNWSGPACEWQANWKLCYVVEKIEDQSFRIAESVSMPNYPGKKGQELTGSEFVERNFLYFGDKYLSDPTRTWESLASDEMHSLFQRIQRLYGWEVYEGWYRAYHKLNEKGFEAPKSAEDKINIIVAILSKECKADLIPLFQMWRFPVTKEQVKAVTDKYKIDDLYASN